MRVWLRRLVDDCAGFTMLEVLVATVLMVIILAALATFTSQWMPNWNRGMARVQQLERLAIGLDRISADLSAAEYVSLNGTIKFPMFSGTPLAVTFVRTAIGPNSKAGLQFVRLVERADQQGVALVREQGAFLPAAPESLPQFSDPVVLIRSPYRVSFSYAAPDQDWQTEWQNVNRLPALIRVSVRDAVSDRVVVASVVVGVNVNVAANCVRSTNVARCLVTGQADNPSSGAMPDAGPAMAPQKSSGPNASN
jgi:general secretion pathway protein J